MQLTETGESRINGYLFVLERSLKTFLPAETVRDAVREIESHLRERVASADGAPNERAALEKIIAELGPPLRVAQAYSAERTMDEAVATGDRSEAVLLPGTPLTVRLNQPVTITQER